MRAATGFRAGGVALMVLAVVSSGPFSAADETGDRPGPSMVVKRMEAIPETGLFEITVGTDDLSVRAFLAAPSPNLGVGDELRVTDLEAVSSSTARRNATVELLTRYGSLTGRLRTDNPFGDRDIDVPAELAAYQLAVWHLTGTSLGATAPVATDRIQGRAEKLAEMATGWDKVLPRPTPVPREVRATTVPYLDGVRVKVTLDGVTPATELVELRSGPDLLGMLPVDHTGRAHFDLPSADRYQGTLTARWRSVLPAGAVMSAPDGRGTVILAGAMDYSVDSEPVEVTKPSPWRNVWSLAVDRGMPVFLAGLIGFAITVAVFIGGAALLDRVTARKAIAAVILGAFAAYGALFWAAQRASRDFDSSWTATAEAQGDIAPIAEPAVAVREPTLELRKERPDTVFAPTCLVDGSPWSSWRPRRHTGPLALVRVTWDGGLAATQVAVLPGYFNGGESAEQVYLITGQPTVVQLFDSRGAATERPIIRPAYVGVDSGVEPQATVIELPSAWESPVFMRVIKIEQGKDSFALAEVGVNGAPADDLPEGDAQFEALAPGPECSSD